MLTGLLLRNILTRLLLRDILTRLLLRNILTRLIGGIILRLVRRIIGRLIGGIIRRLIRRLLLRNITLRLIGRSSWLSIKETILERVFGEETILERVFGEEAILEGITLQSPRLMRLVGIRGIDHMRDSLRHIGLRGHIILRRNTLIRLGRHHLSSGSGALIMTRRHLRHSSLRVVLNSTGVIVVAHLST